MNLRLKTATLGTVALAVGVLIAQDRPRLRRINPPAQPTTAVTGDKDGGRAADRAAIEKSSRDFSAAFAKGDAKACAAFWTDEGEFQDEDGVTRGRLEIEKLFAEFFKESPKSKVHVVIESIHFPARDLAVEEGLLKYESAGKDLPSTTRYSSLHVREAGQWKMAISREFGAGQDYLHDLDWLIGTWSVKLKDAEVRLSFQREKSRPFIVGQFTRTAKGKTESSGTMKIGLDPQSGQLHSWHFDDDGGHGLARWTRDGHNWLLDAGGVTADGIDTAAINVIRRLSRDEFIWRSIERSVGDVSLPDTAPIKLKRNKE